MMRPDSGQGPHSSNSVCSQGGTHSGFTCPEPVSLADTPTPTRQEPVPHTQAGEFEGPLSVLRKAISMLIGQSHSQTKKKGFFCCPQCSYPPHSLQASYSSSHIGWLPWESPLTLLDSIMPVLAWNFTVFNRALSFFSTLFWRQKQILLLPVHSFSSGCNGHSSHFLAHWVRTMSWAPTLYQKGIIKWTPCKQLTV